MIKFSHILYMVSFSSSLCHFVHLQVLAKWILSFRRLALTVTNYLRLIHASTLYFSLIMVQIMRSLKSCLEEQFSSVKVSGWSEDLERNYDSEIKSKIECKLVYGSAVY